MVPNIQREALARAQQRQHQTAQNADSSGQAVFRQKEDVGIPIINLFWLHQRLHHVHNPRGRRRHKQQHCNGQGNQQQGAPNRCILFFHFFWVLLQFRRSRRVSFFADAENFAELRRIYYTCFFPGWQAVIRILSAIHHKFSVTNFRPRSAPGSWYWKYICWWNIILM